jgi:hypothetical protein
MKKTHFAITLLELSTLISQSRAIVTKNRLKIFDSSTPESIINDEFYITAMFAELPIANYFEQQSFFVLRLVKEPKQLESNIASSSLYEVYIGDIETVFPVTKEGKNIVIQSNNLPSIILGEPFFESIWNDFFWHRHANLALCTALEYADEYFLLANEETVAQKSTIKKLIILNDSKSKRPSQDLFMEFLRETLKYKRDIEKYKNEYGNESPLFHISDLLACASLINAEIQDKCRQTFSILKAEESKIKSLSYVLIHDEFNSIVAELITLFKCEEHHILGVLLFLWVRLAKQNGKCRTLSDIKGIIKTINTFDKESTRFALILIGLSEPQESLIQFIHSSKQSSYSIFSALPQKQTDKDILLSDEFFNNVRQGLIDLKKTWTATELKPDVTLDISSKKNLSVPEENASAILVSDAVDSVTSESEVEKSDTVLANIQGQEASPPLGLDQIESLDTEVSKLNSLDEACSDEQSPPAENNSLNTQDDKNQQPLGVELNSQVDTTLPISDNLKNK